MENAFLSKRLGLITKSLRWNCLSQRPDGNGDVQTRKCRCGLGSNFRGQRLGGGAALQQQRSQQHQRQTQIAQHDAG